MRFLKTPPFLSAIITLSIVLTASASAGAQTNTIAQIGPPVVRTPEPDREEIKMRQEQLKKMNSARQAAIKKDTDKLLRLATELKQSVDKSNQNTLSLEVVKKAEEIEKLARSVKDKMRTGY